MLADMFCQIIMVLALSHFGFTVFAFPGYVSVPVCLLLIRLVCLLA